MRSTLSIRSLGEFGVEWNGRPVRPDFWDKRRASILFQLLVGAPDYRLPSDELADRLWPDSTTSQAKVNLAGRIAELRSVFLATNVDGAPPMAPLVVHSGFVAIDSSLGIDVDAGHFESATATALEAASSPEWADGALAAIKRWTGEYLPALTDDAVVARRRRFARLRVALALRLLAESGERGDVRAGVAATFASADHDETLAYALIDRLLQYGETERAVDVYARHSAALARSKLRPAARLELRIAPFRRSELREPRATRADAIVGRATELAAIDDAVAAIAAGTLGAIELAGLPGSGRSRLLQALVDRALAAGIAVGSARGTLQDTAQVVLHDLVRSLTHELTFTERGRRRLAPPNTIVAFGAVDASIDALVNAARWRASRGPVLLALDDAGRVDAAVLAAVVETLASDRELPVAFAFVHDSAQPPIMPGARTIAVSPLDRTDAVTVLRRTMPNPDALDDDALAAIADFWPGNLTMQVAIANETARLAEDEPCLPAALRIDLRLRCEALSPAARAAIRRDLELADDTRSELERAGLLADNGGTLVVPPAIRRLVAAGKLAAN